MWLEKSLTPEDRADNRLVWANIRNVIDDEWDQILSRDLKIAEKDFDQIYGVMEKVYLEKKNLIVQRLGALRVVKAKEELVSDCLKKIYDTLPVCTASKCSFRNHGTVAFNHASPS